MTWAVREINFDVVHGPWLAGDAMAGIRMLLLPGMSAAPNDNA